MAAATKHTKSSVDYSEGMKSAHCAICRHFVTPAQCKLVSGRIDPRYWCKLFSKEKAGK